MFVRRFLFAVLLPIHSQHPDIGSVSTWYMKRISKSTFGKSRGLPFDQMLTIRPSPW